MVSESGLMIPSMLQVKTQFRNIYSEPFLLCPSQKAPLALLGEGGVKEAVFVFMLVQFWRLEFY